MKLDRVLRGMGVALAAALLTACFATAGATELSEAAREVRTGEAEPGPEYVELERVTGRHGAGCGRMGKGGIYESARNALRNAAAALGADYVQIDVDTPPHYTPSCFVNVYELSGIAFRRSGDAPPTPPTTPPDISKMGVERAPCYPNHTCNEGLTCASDLCVRLEPATPAPDVP
ncbi:MAG: hypothetical protein EP329_23740 [Deltaproteobacteria bacterium]|nr:MAG: hypothetical protein EP329_23740 [Deltaproteobacteria bacterium]